MRKKTTATLVIVAVLALGLNGCATHNETGALVGGASGAAVGAGIGGALGGGRWALFGGALGAMLGSVAGAGIGEYFDHKQERNRAEVIQSDGYDATAGYQLNLVHIEATPRVVRPGEAVRVQVTYNVLAPDPQQQIPVTETWVFTHNDRELTRLSRPEELKDQGEHTSTFRFSMADAAIPGPYQTIVMVSNGQEQQAVATQFKVQ